MNKDEDTNQTKNNFVSRQVGLEIQAAKKIGKAYLTFSGWWMIVVCAIIGFAMLFSFSGVWTVNLMGVIPLAIAYYLWRRMRPKK